MSDLDESAARRKRTIGYLGLWGIDVDLTALVVPLTNTTAIPNASAIAGRAKALCLVALKGQGLSQAETFAFADAYEVWDHLSAAENDFVLEPSPEQNDLVQYAWRYEGLHVMLWALGLGAHLGFPAEPTDASRVVERCVQHVLTTTEPTIRRAEKELLDAADIARSLEAIALALPSDAPLPAGMHRGVVYERASLFAWLTPQSQ